MLDKNSLVGFECDWARGSHLCGQVLGKDVTGDVP
jgi:hypothetical protein